MNDRREIDPALHALEARLASAAPRLPAGMGEQLLYQSAFAAGRSAALQAGVPRARLWMGATALFALLSLALGYRTVPLAHPASVDSNENRFAGQSHSETTSSRSSADADGFHSPQLTVATPLDRAVDFNWPILSRRSETSDPDSSPDSSEPVLTTRSRVLPNTL